MHSEAINRKELIPALIGAGICLFFARIGLLALFFLIPLGFLAFKYGYRIAWHAVFLAVTGNIVLSIGTAMMRGSPLAGTFWGIIYFGILASVFTWVIVPPPGLPQQLCGTIRLIIGSCAASLLLILMFFRSLASPAFMEQITSVINSIAFRQGSSGTDVVQAALLAEMTPEMVLNSFAFVVLRGGAVVSSLLLFFLCRQISFILAKLLARDKPISAAGSVALFRVNPVTIWVLSASLLMVVLSSMANLAIPEIILWNILIICAIMYFAQGIGVLLFFIARPALTPFLRLLLCILFFVLVLSPGINVVLLGGVALLGIAENWVSFRVPKSNGPPSTPKAGDDAS